MLQPYLLKSEDLQAYVSRWDSHPESDFGEPSVEPSKGDILSKTALFDKLRVLLLPTTVVVLR